jgi:Skp family chaperone for outer membrane proteins
MRRSSKKIFLFILFTAVLMQLGLAQQAIKIGIVNSQQVLEDSIEGKKIMAQLEEKDKQNREALTKLDDEIRRLETKLSTQRLTLTQEAMAQLSSDIERKRTERKRFTEDTYSEMQELTGRLFNRIQNELLPIIEQIGKEKNMDLIFDLARSGTIYFNPVIDLTPDVIKAYDASKAAK